MNSKLRILILITILALTTQQIRLPFGSLSIYQICVALTAICCLPFILTRNVIGGGYLKISIIWAISSVIAFCTSINENWARSYLLLGLMTSIMFFVIPNMFQRKDVELLEKTMIRSQYIVIPFSVYCFLIFSAIGTFPDHILLPGGLYVELDEEAMERTMTMGQMRLMLPYATPPVLSIVMSMCVTLLIFSDGLFKTMYKWVLILIFSVILLMTGSRSGMIGLAILTVILFINGDLKKYFHKINKGALFFGLMCIIAFIIYALQTEYVTKLFIDRTKESTSTSVFEDRHLLVPVDGILIWLDSVSNFVLGIGFGSSEFMKGEHTYLPPYFLNNYVTLLAERGILGFILVCMLINLGRRLYKYRNYLTTNEKSFVYALIVGMFSSITYESMNCYFMIFFVAIGLMLCDQIKLDLKHK